MKTRLTHEELLQHLAQFILDATNAAQENGLSEEELPTAADMARALSLDLDVVKKKLVVLKKEALIQTLSFSPKRYRFDHYAFRHMPESSELYPYFCSDDPLYPLNLS